MVVFVVSVPRRNRLNTNHRMARKKQPESERMLVAAAAFDPVARERLRQNLRPFVAKAVRKYMQRWGIPKNRYAELTEVGMEPFDRVFNIYLTRRSEHDVDYEGLFYDYYIWWMRQAVTAYLNPDEKQ